MDNRIFKEDRKILRLFTSDTDELQSLYNICDQTHGRQPMGGQITKGSIFIEKDKKEATKREYHEYDLRGVDPTYKFEVSYDIKQYFSKCGRSFILSPGATEYGYYDIPIKFIEIPDNQRKQDLYDRVLGEYNIDLPQKIVNMIMNFNLYQGHYKLILQSYIARDENNLEELKENKIKRALLLYYNFIGKSMDNEDNKSLD